MQLQTTVGQPATASVGSGAALNVRSGQLGDTIVSELQPRFYEANYRGNLYGGGMTLTALTANTIALTSSATPIVGLNNPYGSSVNLVVTQASLLCVANNLTSGAGPGAFVWAWSIGNTASMSAALQGWNRKSLVQQGGSGKFFTIAAALTGLTNNVVVQEVADFSSPSGLTYTTLGSTATMQSYGGVQNFDGQLIVPPGGVLALLNTVSSTTWSAASRILWEEVPL